MKLIAVSLSLLLRFMYFAICCVSLILIFQHSSGWVTVGLVVGCVLVLVVVASVLARCLLNLEKVQ